MEDMDSKNTDGILDENELRSFWISWLNGHIEVGEGHQPGVNRLVDWLDPHVNNEVIP